MNIEAVYEVMRINPFVPVGKKGKTPLYALMPIKQYKDMKRELRSKCPPLPENGGLVVCTIIDREAETELGKGSAICSLSDKFDFMVGAKLALERAQGRVTNQFTFVRVQVAGALAKLK